MKKVGKYNDVAIIWAINKLQVSESQRKLFALMAILRGSKNQLSEIIYSA